MISLVRILLANQSPPKYKHSGYDDWAMQHQIKHNMYDDNMNMT